VRHVVVWWAYLAAVSPLVVVAAGGVYGRGGGRGGQDIDDVGVHQVVLLVQQVKDPNGVRPIWTEEKRRETKKKLLLSNGVNQLFSIRLRKRSGQS
jgi:hypothetical protein